MLGFLCLASAIPGTHCLEFCSEMYFLFPALSVEKAEILLPCSYDSFILKPGLCPNSGSWLPTSSATLVYCSRLQKRKHLQPEKKPEPQPEQEDFFEYLKVLKRAAWQETPTQDRVASCCLMWLSPYSEQQQPQGLLSPAPPLHSKLILCFLFFCA